MFLLIDREQGTLVLYKYALVVKGQDDLKLLRNINVSVLINWAQTAVEAWPGCSADLTTQPETVLYTAHPGSRSPWAKCKHTVYDNIPCRGQLSIIQISTSSNYGANLLKGSALFMSVWMSGKDERKPRTCESPY